MSERFEPTMTYIYDLEDMRMPEDEDTRPKNWDLVTAKLFCQKVAEGQLLVKAMHEMVEEKHIPTINWINKWKGGYDFFRAMLDLAKQERTEAFFEEIVEIADDATDDAVMGANGPMINGKAIRRAELMINTRKFVMAKSNPTRYGDKTQMEITGKDGKDLVPTAINIQLIPAGNFISQDEAAQEREQQLSDKYGNSEPVE